MLSHGFGRVLHSLGSSCCQRSSVQECLSRRDFTIHRNYRYYKLISTVATEQVCVKNEWVHSDATSLICRNGKLGCFEDMGVALAVNLMNRDVLFVSVSKRSWWNKPILSLLMNNCLQQSKHPEEANNWFNMFFIDMCVYGLEYEKKLFITSRVIGVECNIPHK